MIKKLTTFVLIVFIFALHVHAQRIISPEPGNFSNKQTLVLDTSDGAECFYSFSGTDPLTSGFAYDGPVLIDSIGRVTVRVAVVFGEDQFEETEIIFNVQENNPFEQTSKENQFISKISDEGIVTYNSDSPVDIPENLSYSLGSGEKPYLSGTVLKLSSENSLSRYVPCSVSDGKNIWRFVIFISSGEIGTLSKYSVPFEIRDWNTFIFTGEKLIWSIDDGEWSASKLPVQIDRRTRHMIFWQSVAYEPGNPVQSFVLPPEPSVVSSRTGSGAVNFCVEGDLRYRMALISAGVMGESGENTGLFRSAVFDTFVGDSISGEAVFAFYCDGVAQGVKRSFYTVDRQPPLPPKFVPSNSSFYSRGSVDLEIKSEAGSKLVYAISAPVKVPVGDFEYDSVEFDSIEAGKFRPYDGKIKLESGSESAIFYKVRAFATDSAGNTSSVSEYRVIIDEYNYYLDSTAQTTFSDGSKKNPFTSFEQAVEVINSGRYAHFYVNGTFNLPPKETIINSNCAFSAVNESRFVLPPEASILVRSASFEAHNLIIEKTRLSSFDSNSKFFTLENSTASFTDCEIVAVFGENGTGFTAQNSVIELNKSGLTVQADSYACGISCVDSKLFSKNSRVASVAQTAVNFSVTGGIFECRSSNCKVTAHLGRAAELSGTNLRMTNNVFTGELDKKVRGVVPVWKDKDTLVLEDKNNTSSGF